MAKNGSGLILPNLSYPRYAIRKGDVDEYNGIFMINQMLLRDSSALSPPSHARKIYRNFFHSNTQWQFFRNTTREKFMTTTFAQEVERGLSESSKCLIFKYFYDKKWITARLNLLKNEKVDQLIIPNITLHEALTYTSHKLSVIDPVVLATQKIKMLKI